MTSYLFILNLFCCRRALNVIFVLSFLKVVFLVIQPLKTDESKSVSNILQSTSFLHEETLGSENIFFFRFCPLI